jgi:hypothetical protein
VSCKLCTTTATTLGDLHDLLPRSVTSSRQLCELHDHGHGARRPPRPPPANSANSHELCKLPRTLRTPANSAPTNYEPHQFSKPSTARRPPQLCKLPPTLQTPANSSPTLCEPHKFSKPSTLAVLVIYKLSFGQKIVRPKNSSAELLFGRNINVGKKKSSRPILYTQIEGTFIAQFDLTFILSAEI